MNLYKTLVIAIKLHVYVGLAYSQTSANLETLFKLSLEISIYKPYDQKLWSY